MRVKGSCRFETYYKIQRWDAEWMAWRDIQRAFKSPGDAELSAPEGAKYRLVTISESGRTYSETREAIA